MLFVVEFVKVHKRQLVVFMCVHSFKFSVDFLGVVGSD